MERKLKYQAPAILEELKLEMEGSILAASHPGDQVEFEDVEAMGQEVAGNAEFEHEWAN